MRMILLAGAVLALSACGGGNDSNEANALAPDNMMMDGNMALDQNMMVDQNGAMNGSAAAGNGAVDAATQNMMQKDANTNDRDTNLANGI